MRRILIGMTLASIVAAAAIFLSQFDRRSDHTETERFRFEWNQAQGEDWPEELEHLLLEAERLRVLQNDPKMSLVDCRVVAEEPLGGNRFLLTEECAVRGVVVERRRFPAFRKEDGSSYGWMYRPTESDT